MEEVIIGASMIDSKKIKNCICATSSHNLTSEKQFRNPVEYGAPKPKTATFTSTGGASILLTNEKTDIKGDFFSNLWHLSLEFMAHIILFLFIS